MIKYSIIIPFYGTTNHSLSQLKDCLCNIQMCEKIEDSEIIVVDDASPLQPSVVENIIKDFNVRYFRFTHNRGPGIVRNEGAMHSSGDILLFTDHDCLPTLHWIVALTQPIVEQKCSATTATYVDCLTRTWCTEYQYFDFEYRMPSIECRVDFLHTCSCAIERSIFLESGGFPPERYYEDQLLGQKLIQNGKKILYIPSGGVKHDFRPNLKAFLKQQFHFGKAIATYFISNALLFKKLFFAKKGDLFRKSYLKPFLMLGLILGEFTLFLYSFLPTHQLYFMPITFLFIATMIVVQLDFLIFIFRKKRSLWRSISYFPLIILLHCVFMYSCISALFFKQKMKKLN